MCRLQIPLLLYDVADKVEYVKICQPATWTLQKNIWYRVPGLPLSRTQKIPWLFTDLKTIFTDLALGDLPNKLLVKSLTLASVSFVDHQYSYLHVQSLYVFHGILNARHFKCLVFKIPWIPWKSREFPEFQKIPWLSTLNSKKKSLTFHWLWQELRFSLTFCKIPWLFPDFENFLLFPDWVATLAGPEFNCVT